MSDLRNNIERADRERQAKKFEEQQRQRREIEAAQENTWLEKKRNEDLVREARPYVDQYLMPIFRDVAAAKRISMRSTSGFFGGTRDGFNRLDFGGQLIWNHREGRSSYYVRYGSSTYTAWDELTLELSHEGNAWNCWGVDIVKDYSQLIEKVAQYVVSGATSRGGDVAPSGYYDQM